MIIDSHAHTDECPIRGYFDPPEKVVSIMDRAGIDMAVVSTYRNAPEADPRIVEYVAEGAAKYPGRLIPFVRLNPRFGDLALDVLDRAVKEFGFRGVKLHPASYNLIPFGDATVNIFKRAADYGLPVLLHCTDEMMCLPLQIEMAMERSPRTVVILAHVGGFFHTEDVVRVCERKPNAYIDTSEIPNAKKLKYVVDRIGPERLLFGTDIPTDNPELEIYKVRASGIGEEASEMVLWKNAARLLNIDAAALRGV
jgi:predicted TIM-barrel fold metal-dependent hydrolase